MSSLLRMALPGALSHVTSRGNARLAISHDDADHSLFLKTLQALVTRSHWRCHVWRLLAHHAHLRIERPRAICL